MRKMFIVVSVLILLLVDQAFLPFLSIFNSTGSVMFTFMGLFMMRTDDEDAFFIGIITGVAQDLFFPYVFGLNTIFNVMLFIGLSKIGLTLKEGRKAVPVFSVAVAQGVKTFLMLLILKLFGIGGNYYAVLVMPLYTLALGALMYRIAAGYSRIPVVKKEWRF